MKDTINVKNKKWQFDNDVTNCFGDMLSRSIPDYNNMREIVKKIGFSFVQQGTNIIDIGCSDGRAITPFVNNFKQNNKYICYDVSDSMLEVCRKKFDNYKEHCIIENYDLRNGIDIKNTSVCLSILTLQFTPIEYRQKIINSIYNSLNKNGILILVEKVLGNTLEIDNLLVNEYYKIKKENKYTEEQIVNKRKSLEGVLVPITSEWNIELLKNAGFKNVDCFWRYLNFCGWVAIK